MTDQDHAQEKLIRALRESEERYRSITETSIDAIITSNSQDVVLTWNQGAAKIFGRDAEMIGRLVSELVPPKYREAHNNGIKKYLATGERRIIGKTIELEALRSDGSVFMIELSLSTWESGGDHFFGAIIRDISDRKRVEFLRDLVNRIIRHDLKSPLVGVVGMAKMLLRGDNLTVKQRQSAAFIQELGEKMLGFINRSQDLYKIEEGVYELDAVPLNLWSILDGVGTTLSHPAQHAGVGLVFLEEGRPVGPEAKRTLWGEAGLLEMMFSNLLKNALEASPPGASVTLDLRAEERGGREVVVADIHNRGVIPENIRRNFFEPYVTSGKRGGSGLGTHSARLAALAHHGEIEFHTSDEKGTNVLVILPVRP
ncbi:MAG: PAS domain-containing sensor histidine kinase [Pseudomonadota bacterium]